MSRKGGTKLTITKLAKLAGTTRPTIYKYFEKMGFDKKNITPEVEKNVIDHFSKRIKSNSKIKASSKKSIIKPKFKAKKLTTDVVETAEERLLNAKSDYNFNVTMISKFKNEIDLYIEENGCTTYENSSGGTSAIPQIKQLENYIKMNIALNKTIQELEQTLDIIRLNGNSSEDNPFAN